MIELDEMDVLWEKSKLTKPPELFYWQLCQAPRCHFFKSLEAPGRLELPAKSLGNSCSIHLSYGANFPFLRLALTGEFS